MKPAELKKTRGEQSQTDVLKRDYGFVFFCLFRSEANRQRGKVRVRVKEEGRNPGLKTEFHFVCVSTSLCL